MRKYNPYRNIFYYYRGPSSREEKREIQIEDNTTKALINTLENGENELLAMFFKTAKVNINTKGKIDYDLQVPGESSRPDAEIKIGQHALFIESKVGAKIDRNQLKRHIKNISKLDIKSTLLCIAPHDSIKNVLEINNVKFITWQEIYTSFKKYLERAKSDKTKFVLHEFLKYLEAIDMNRFNGWGKNDFEAFLNIEDDSGRELRIRVNNKMRKYLEELRILIVREKIYKDLEVDVGNMKEKSVLSWGVLCNPPTKEKVQKPHFNFIVNSDEFSMGVQIEGLKPARKMMKNMYADKQRFFKILKGLKGFDLIIKERVNLSGLPRDLHGICDNIKIRIGKDTSIKDVEYILYKMEHFKYPEIHCGKSFKRDEKTLKSEKFLKESTLIMKRLQMYYDFSLENIR